MTETKRIPDMLILSIQNLIKNYGYSCGDCNWISDFGVRILCKLSFNKDPIGKILGEERFNATGIEIHNRSLSETPDYIVWLLFDKVSDYVWSGGDSFDVIGRLNKEFITRELLTYNESCIKDIIE
jgi:predicted transglutaminase-like protease